MIAPLDNLPRILNIHESTINDSRYRWNAELHGPLRHQNRSVFQYTLAGRGAFDDGKEVHSLTEGTGFLTNINDDNYRYYQPEDSREGQRVLWCNLQSVHTMKMTAEINRKFGYIFRLHTSSGIIQRLRSFNRPGISHMTMTASENARLASELLYDLIWSREAENRAKCEELLLEKALGIINTHGEILFSAGDLAERLSVSREHLSRVFKDQLGTGPYRYMVLGKMEAAKIHLRNTSTPINRISDSLGFTSPVQFSSLFKKFTGVSPRDYRKIYRDR